MSPLFLKKKRNAKIMSKEQYYIYGLLYWLYTAIWLTIGIYVFYSTSIGLGVKIVIAFIMLLTTPDLPIFAQSYCSYREKIISFRDTADKNIKYIKGKYTDEHMFTGVEVSLEKVKAIFKDRNLSCLVEFHEMDNIVVLKEKYDVTFHRCSGDEWDDIIKFIEVYSQSK